MGFRITRKKGFQITFENGYTVSVQFGIANYCIHHHKAIIGTDGEIIDEGIAGAEGSPDAETALLDSKGKFVEYDGDDVQGYRTPEQVLELLNFAANIKDKKNETAV